MATHFTTPEILAATRGALVQGSLQEGFCGISTDSRVCQSGQLFIPLRGEKHDAHDFLPAALHRGVRGVLVEKGSSRWRRLAFPGEVTVIAVDDTLTALGDLARAWRLRFALPLVAITGSCGKTTTKEMTATVLAQRYQVLKNRLNLNNLIGLPQTLLGLDHTHEAAVVEMGMNRFGEIQRLTEIAHPQVGVLTNVHPAHTEGVGDVGGVAQAKGELARSLDAGGLLIYNSDDPWLARATAAFPGRTCGFGLGGEALLRAQERQTRGSHGQTARLWYQGRSWQLALAVPGQHQFYNALAATAVGLSLGLAPEETASALADFRPPARRSQVLPLPSGVQLLNDCYNANPASMAAALETLRELRDRGRAVAALGDMLELGSLSVSAHRELGRRAARSGLDLLVIYGKFRQEVAAGAHEEGLPWSHILPVGKLPDAARALKGYLAPGDWLLVKGSRSMHMEGLIDLLEESDW